MIFLTAASRLKWHILEDERVRQQNPGVEGWGVMTRSVESGQQLTSIVPAVAT